MYCRDSNHPVDAVLTEVIDVPRFILKRNLKKGYKEYVTRVFNGHPVKMDSLRYQMFKAKGTACCVCGLQGTHFGLETEKTHVVANGENAPYHFNLYGMKDGHEVLLTKDHIIPKSKGGKDILDNMQTMCYICNFEKGNQFEGEANETH